jgi:hypothetical protein
MPGGGYGHMSGTSMASPHVNGVVALIRQAAPDISVEAIKEIIFQSAYDLGDPGEDNSYGWGMIDAYEAIMLTNKNPDTPSKPSGPDLWAQYMQTSFETTTTDPEGDSISYMFDWGDGTYSEWIGPYASGQIAEASHIWEEMGEYNIKVKARDDEYGSSEWSEPHILTIVENQPPEKPTMCDGPSSGRTRKLLKFTFTTTDVEGNDFYFLISWGDGDIEYWDGPYSSGEEVEFGHSWSEGGEYSIKVKAKDQYGAKGAQSSFKLKISKSRSISNPLFTRIFMRYPNAFPLIRQILGL